MRIKSIKYACIRSDLLCFHEFIFIVNYETQVSRARDISGSCWPDLNSVLIDRVELSAVVLIVAIRECVIINCASKSHYNDE